MKRALIVAAVLSALLFPQTRADVVNLLSGEKIEGKIISEDADSVRVEVRVSASILDERVIPRAEVANIEKPEPDQAAFAELEPIRLDPQRSQASAWYDAALAKIDAFKAAYPLSVSLPAAEAKAAEIKAERDRVAAGDLKFGGKWYSKEEAEKRGVELRGAALFDGMKAQAASGDLPGALATFDRIESEASGSPAYPDAVALAGQVLQALSATVERNISAIEQEKARIERDIKMLPVAQQEEVKRVRAAEKERADQAVKSASGKWKPFIPNSEASMNAYKRMLPQEAGRLAKVKVDDLRAAVAEIESAKGALAADKLAAAEASLAAADKLWPKNSATAAIRDEIKKAKSKGRGGSGDATASEGEGGESAAADGAGAAGSKKGAGADGGEEKPFWLTLNGALTGLGAILAIIVIGGWISKMGAKRREQ